MNTLSAIPGTFSLCSFLDYMDDHFYGVHARTTIDGYNEFCYDRNGNLLAFYDGLHKELWAVNVSAVA